MKKETEKQSRVVEKEKSDNLVDQIVKVTVNKMTQDRPSITAVLFSKKEEFESIAINSLQKSNLEKYLSQMSLYIAREKSLTKCFESREGKISLIKAVDEAVSLGLLPGVDAYITPYGTYVDEKYVTIGRLDPTAEGYAAMCCSEPNPLFRQIKTGIVRENDKVFEIDKAEGILKHTPDYLDDDSRIVGAWIKCLPADDRNEPVIEYYSLKRILTARERSSAWKSYRENTSLYKECKKGKDGQYPKAVKDKKGNYTIANFKGKWPKEVRSEENSTTPIWTTDEEKMILKTIQKSVLKPYAKIKMGIQRSSDIFNEENITEKKYDNIKDQAHDILDKNAPESDEQFFDKAAE